MMRIFLFLATNIAVLIIASITLKLLGVDRFTGQNHGDLLIFCAVFGFTGSFISLFLSKWMAKKSTGTQIIDQPRTHQEQWLVSTVQRMAQQKGIGMPEVGIFPAYEANAFATGWNRNNALVAVSQGLLERFSREEVEAVLAHEIGHVANGDMVTLTLIQGVVNTFVLFFARIFCNFIYKAVLKNESDSLGIGYYVATIVAELLDFFMEYHKDEKWGFVGAPLHDPCTIAWLLKPEIFTTVERWVGVEIQGKYTRG